ncbi:MAG: hypothetical protein HQM06_07020 [Magnetococcales bacterium]|nr:hypothetical protein [Magnetococcales bacterium]
MKRTLLWLLLCIGCAANGGAATLRDGMPVIRGLYLGMPIKEVMDLAKFRLELQLQHEEEGHYAFARSAGKGWRAFSTLRQQSLPDDLLLQTDRSGKVVSLWLSGAFVRHLFPQAERLSWEQFVAFFANEHRLPPWSLHGQGRSYGWYNLEQPHQFSMKIDSAYCFWMYGLSMEGGER